MDARPASPTDDSPARGEPLFAGIVVGIDETPESLVGAAQAGVLRAPGGRLVLIAVAERYLAAHAGMAAPYAEDELMTGTLTELERAKELVDADDTIVASGRLVEVLCRECARTGARLIVVGVRPHRRMAARTFGGHDVDALRDARCSVLVARPGWGPAKPERILVGVDGSRQSSAAEAAARSLGERLGCDVLPIVGLEDGVSPGVLRAERDVALLGTGALADAVVEASTPRSLIVVGRTAEHGRREDRTVERIVYAARCSVLVLQHDVDAAG
jgi:nucleotide-binding universal stress UspA family protein